MKKCLKRCPECKSSDIHKRSRILVGSGNKKGRCVKFTIAGRERTANYKCYNCKHEFDTPLVSD
jgi:hypothetical protein